MIKREQVDWYQQILTLADAKGCLVDIQRDEDNLEAWLMVNGKKYFLRGWKLGIDELWLQGIYMKKGEEFMLLFDSQIKRLFNEIDGLEGVEEF
jgi:hypothetical protein